MVRPDSVMVIVLYPKSLSRRRASAGPAPWLDASSGLAHGVEHPKHTPSVGCRNAWCTPMSRSTRSARAFWLRAKHKVEDLIRNTHEQAFDARPEFTSLIVDPDGRRSALEADFVAATPPSSLAYQQPAPMSASPTAFTTTSPTAASRPYVSTVWRKDW